jgi:hypothetical protein
LIWEILEYGTKIKRERKKVVGVKLKVYYIHVPPLHDRDTKMNIKTSKNDVFGY